MRIAILAMKTRKRPKIIALANMIVVCLLQRYKKGR